MGKDNKEQNNTESSASVVTRETVGLTLGVFSVLIMIMLFTGSLIFGDLGESICSFLFGTFGFMSYFLFPCVLFAAVALVMGKNPIKIKGLTLFGGLSLFFIGLLAHVIGTGGYSHDSYGSYLSECFVAGKNGAFGCSPFGAIGGIIAYPFTALATNAGAIVIFVVASGLCLYLAVNSILVFKGIRWGIKRDSANIDKKKEEERVRTEQKNAQPTRFESLDNVRTAEQTKETANYTPSPSYENTTPRTPSYHPVQGGGYTPVNIPVSSGGQAALYGTPNGNYSTPTDDRPYRTNEGQQNGGTANDRSNFNANYNILYGNNENPDEYRNKNLIFDASSRYNSRIQNNPSVQKEYPNYSEYSSREIDREQTANRQQREVVLPTETQSENARHGYSVYKTDVFDSRPTSSPLGDSEPLQPRYKAPDPPVATPRVPPEPTAWKESERGGTRNGVEYGYSETLNRAPSFTEEDRPNPIQSSGTAERLDRTAIRGTENVERETFSPEIPTSRDGGMSRDYEGRGVERARSFRNLFDDEPEAEEPIEESSVPDFNAERNDRDRGDRGEFLPEQDSDDADFTADSYFEEQSGTEKDFNALAANSRGSMGRDRISPLDTGERAVAVPEQKEIKPHVFKDYVRPPVDLFAEYKDSAPVDYNEIERNKLDIVDTLAAFKIDIQITNVQVGPTFTRYDFTFPKNVNANSISKYSNNIALALKVAGKVNICTNFANGTMAIEVPNKVRPIVGFRSLLGADEYINAKTGALQICIGKNVDGRTATASLAKMTHLLVAGTTGSGKSVFLHEIIMSLIMKYSPEEVRLILIDPKQVEFSLYDNLPHLMINEILSDPNKIVVMLNWTINEMERRYTLFRYGGVRNIDEFNAAAKKREEKLPKIVIIADEVADIMAVAKKEVEDRISRLAAKARAAGIHLVLATQRPTVEVITGTLKANLPSRFALRVSEELNSRIVLDESGAENLLGNGDLLYKWGSMFNAERVQAPFIDTSEIQRVCDFIRQNNESYFDQSAADFINSGGKQSASSQDGQEGEGDGEVEPVYIDALRFVVRSGSASISMIQRKCSVGYNKAGKIIEWMEMNKYISEFDGAKSRKVLLTAEEFVEKFGEL